MMLVDNLRRRFGRPSAAVRGGAILGLAAILTLAAPAAARAQLDVAGLVGYAVSSVDTRFSDVEAAIVRFRNGDIAGAKELLDGVRQRVPELPPSQVTLAKMYFAANQEAQGRAALDEAATKAPDDPEAFVLLGDLDLQQGHVTGAALLMEKGLVLAEKLQNSAKRRRSLVVRSTSALATIAERREDWAAATRVLQRWLTESPGETAALRRLGRAQFMQKDYQAAYASFAKARELDATLPGPDVTVGRLFGQEGDDAQAAKFMDRAMQADADNLNTLLVYAQWALDKNDLDLAQKTLANAKRLDDASVDALLLEGVIARLKSQLPEAEKSFETAHLLDPVNFNAVNQLALVLISQTDKEKRDRAVKYAEINARNFRQSAEAEQMLSSAVQLGGLNADSSYLVAKMMYDSGRKPEAARLLEQAVSSKQMFVQRGPAEALLAVIRSEPGGAAGN